MIESIHNADVRAEGHGLFLWRFCAPVGTEPRPPKQQNTYATFSRWKDGLLAFRKSDPGFTLIELLIAMAILVVIVMMTAQIFHQVTVSWDTGARKAELNMTGRAIVDLIAKDLEQTVCDSMLIQSGSIPFFNIPSGGSTAEFMMMDAEPTASNRTIRGVRYAYDSTLKYITRESKLWRSSVIYSNINFSTVSLIETTTANGILCGTQRVERLVFTLPPGNTNIPPRYVDVMVEVGQPQDLFVTNTMTYTARAYLQFRNRYVFD